MLALTTSSCHPKSSRAMHPAPSTLAAHHPYTSLPLLPEQIHNPHHTPFRNPCHVVCARPAISIQQKKRTEHQRGQLFRQPPLLLRQQQVSFIFSYLPCAITCSASNKEIAWGCPHPMPVHFQSCELCGSVFQGPVGPPATQRRVAMTHIAFRSSVCLLLLCFHFLPSVGRCLGVNSYL